ncbi:MAG: hypothetical protein L0387_18145 [Acidobacteria bacterium]|nr:hypothetical protein [Acidobacteriota bacterium]MCI0623551.1 hypothetical protein [Acidobacteriota bacterium]MCI0719109.1 hypothetical protein [Acidobacteriota bacterium]
MLKQLFHLKNVEHSFRENAIELVYEIRNLSSRELLVQELNRAAYLSVHPLEREMLTTFRLASILRVNSQLGESAGKGRQLSIGRARAQNRWFRRCRSQ